MIKRLIKVLSIIVLSIIVIIAFVKFLQIIDFRCFYRELFDIYCAGCGSTRMFESLFNFEIYQAFRYNPLIFILLIISLIYLIINIIRYVFLNKVFIKPSKEVLILIGILLIIYMVLRNVPGFEFLQPIEV